MGADQSKPSQDAEKIVYGDQSSVNFSADLLSHLSDTHASPHPTPERQETLDAHIRSRIHAELQRLQHEETEVRAEIERVLEKENLDREAASVSASAPAEGEGEEGAVEEKEVAGPGAVHSGILSRDMEELRKKVERFESGKMMRGEGREEVKEKQDALVACYKANPTRSLDCWREVGEFKASVAKLEDRYIRSFQ
ncbi:hypothetical protein DACRYDRAFT_20085 [Dacryopinax primogenitus]|uniref:DUF1690-domain-containing protein n=1 Tax=Dacryopinax primogenitus (strain DJM 731) TaxID=1858805 RepID=M5G5Y5_DACPD|nr:uncharacterized protein DACRYDRAFT_20085 [Dacryopinax primogenitus]EJU05671.1 hypothetical protein DACRYDRAFT_20085 [Dacryopinax primogenitus]